MIGVYLESWACSSSLQLTKIEKPIDTIFLSFVKPFNSYKRGQNSFSGTGLDFNLDFASVKNAVAFLKQKGMQVLLAIGGATYPFDNYQPYACADLMNDLGLDGIDIDWEPVNGYAERSKLGPILQVSREAIGPTKLMTMAGFSTGCFDPNSYDKYRGLNIDGIKSHGHLLNWINIMAYDAGKEYNVLDGYASYKKYFPKTVAVGFQVGKQGWGDALLTLQDVEKVCKSMDKGDGCFVWAYFKSGPPSATDVCQVASTALSRPPPSQPIPLNQFQCPQCKSKLTVTC
jgi:hypothetical protein